MLGWDYYVLLLPLQIKPLNLCINALIFDLHALSFSLPDDGETTIFLEMWVNWLIVFPPFHFVRDMRFLYTHCRSQMVSWIFVKIKNLPSPNEFTNRNIQDGERYSIQIRILVNHYLINDYLLLFVHRPQESKRSTQAVIRQRLTPIFFIANFRLSVVLCLEDINTKRVGRNFQPINKYEVIVTQSIQEKLNPNTRNDDFPLLLT